MTPKMMLEIASGDMRLACEVCGTAKTFTRSMGQERVLP